MANPNSPILSNPRNRQPVTGNVITFTFDVPSDSDFDKLVFKLDIDTVDTFNSVNLKTNESRLSADQKTNGKWEVYNGSEFIIMPTGGIGSSYYGNEARLTIRKQDTDNFPWIDSTWYWKISAGDGMEYAPVFNQAIYAKVVFTST